MAGAVRSREAERLALCRRAMVLAMSEGISVVEARVRIECADRRAARRAREARTARPIAANAGQAATSPPWMMAE